MKRTFLICLILAGCNFIAADSINHERNELFSNLIEPRALKEIFKNIDIYSAVKNVDSATSKINDTCADNLADVLFNIRSQWAIRMIDASGKPPSGMLDGKFYWIGDFFECEHIVATTNSSHFKGRYCTLAFNLGIKKDIALPITLGVCVPSTCGEDNFLSLLNFKGPNEKVLKVKGLTLNLTVTSATCHVEERHFDASAIGTLFVLSVFLLFIIVGTTFTIVQKYYIIHKEQNEQSNINYNVLDENTQNSSVTETNNDRYNDNFFMSFLKSFCFLTNGSKVFNTNNKGDLQCIHGIRFLSMTWVILGHTYAFAALLLLSGNMKQLGQEIDTVAFEAITQGTYSVDSFFLMSGFLLSYLFLKEATKRDGKMSWVYFYVHRYWRLTPIYALVIAFNTALVIYVADGPFWPKESLDPTCRSGWWWNLLYINNFADASHSCVAWGWYLANDMQFYVISPIFLYLLWRWPKIGLSLIGSMILASWITTGIISYDLNLIAGYTELTTLTNAVQLQQSMAVYFQKVYIKPYTRIGPYLIGVLLGYLFHSNPKRKLPMWVVYLGWSLASSAGLSMIYAFYHTNLGPVLAAAYNALSRSVFSASLAWLMYACLLGYGGVIDAILSWKAIVPLSRLTYCAYLVHPIILEAFYYSLNSSMQITNVLMTTLFCGFLVLSYGTALVCSLAFESPMMAVEKLVLTKLRSRQNKQIN